jgi:hypothetical protein
MLYSQNSQKLLFSVEHYSPNQKEFTHKNNLQNLYCIYQMEFVPKDSSYYSKELMEKSLNRDIPDKNEIGYATLDWEGDSYMILIGRKNASSQEYQKTLLKFIDALQYAKKLRPNIKWSYYNMPLINYYDDNHQDKREQVLKSLTLLKELDFFTPSTYILADKLNDKDSIIFQYIDSNITFALDMGAKLHKPVYPFVWHRFAPNSKNNGWTIMDTSYFQIIVKRILNLGYNKNKVNGIIWWNCEYNMYDIRNKNKTISDEYINVQDFGKYQFDIFQKYYNSIKLLFN